MNFFWYNRTKYFLNTASFFILLCVFFPFSPLQQFANYYHISRCCQRGLLLTKPVPCLKGCFTSLARSKTNADSGLLFIVSDRWKDIDTSEWRPFRGRWPEVVQTTRPLIGPFVAAFLEMSSTVNKRVYVGSSLSQNPRGTLPRARDVKRWIDKKILILFSHPWKFHARREFCCIHKWCEYINVKGGGCRVKTQKAPMAVCSRNGTFEIPNRN